MVNTPVGPEWNTMKSTVNMTRPKLKTKAGDLIKPMEVPKAQK
jgi:U3 small nucleolar RNA-associated protein 14